MKVLVQFLIEQLFSGIVVLKFMMKFLAVIIFSVALLTVVSAPTIYAQEPVQTGTEECDPQLEEECPEEEPVIEVQQEPDSNLEKGEPSNETVAGTDEVFADPEPAVLGAATETPESTPAVLAATGVSTMTAIIVGTIISVLTLSMFRKRTVQKQRVQK